MNDKKPILSIKTCNKQPYMDIMKDIMVKKNGLFSFTLKCDSSKITDYAVTENVKPK
jgi:hypothetical protein